MAIEVKTKLEPQSGGIIIRVNRNYLIDQGWDGTNKLASIVINVDDADYYTIPYNDTFTGSNDEDATYIIKIPWSDIESTGAEDTFELSVRLIADDPDTEAVQLYEEYTHTYNSAVLYAMRFLPFGAWTYTDYIL